MSFYRDIDDKSKKPALNIFTTAPALYTSLRSPTQTLTPQEAAVGPLSTNGVIPKFMLKSIGSLSPVTAIPDAMNDLGGAPEPSEF